MATKETARGSLAGRYELDAEIGRGRSGSVWRARDTLLGRAAAVREVRLPRGLSAADNAAIRGRLLRATRTARAVDHPSAVKILDAFEAEDTVYVVMELIQAPTLAQVVVESGPLDARTAARLGLRVLDALEKAHGLGIVHGDVKPGNVMVTGEGAAKLAGFGTGALKADPRITAAGHLLGSPSYMAPEQAQDDYSGAPADLWALGATLYFAVEGVAPFDRGKPIPTLAAVVYDEPRPPRLAGALAPPISQLLQKGPDDRPSAAGLRRGLEDAVSAAGRAGGIDAASDPRAALGGPEVAAETLVIRLDAPDEARSGPDSARRWTLVATWLTLLGLLGAGLWLALATLDHSPEGRATPPASSAEGGPVVPGDAPSDGADPAVPDDWVPFVDVASGLQIFHPPDWEVVERPTDEDSVDFRDRDTGAYLRVDWTDGPGPSPQLAWLDYEPSFASAHGNYERIQITPTTFMGFEASLWEFTYRDGGTDLHAVDLGFLTEDHGFALFYQTHAEDWEAAGGLFEVFKASFSPPP